MNMLLRDLNSGNLKDIYEDPEKFRFFIVAFYGSIVGLLGHISFIFLFAFVGITTLSIANIISSIIWIFIYLANKKGFSNITLIFASIEVVVHAILAVVIIGWNSGFHYYIVCLIPFVILAPNWLKIYKILASTVLCIIYFLLNLHSVETAAIVKLGGTTLTILNLVNIIMLFAIFSIFTYYLNDATQKYESELRSLNERLNLLAKLDPLTGISNRRGVMERVEEELTRQSLCKNKISVVLADIDDFKVFNDTFGHDCGDYVLREISRIINETIGEKNFMGRWGGEEFLIILPELNIPMAMDLTEKIRNNIEKKIFNYEGNSISITMTFGLSVIDNDNMMDCIRKADEALRKGKSKGKNCIHC